MDRQNPFYVAATTLLACLVASAAAWAERVQVETREGPREAGIVIIWKEPVDFSQQVEGRTLVLQFSRAIEIDDLRALNREKPLWIENISTSYDAVLVQSSRDVGFSVRVDDNRVEILLEPESRSVAPAVDDHAELQLDLIRAQLLIETERFGEASQLLGRLKSENPDDVRVIGTMAALEQTLQKRRVAADLYQEAIGLEPQNEDYQEALETLTGPLRPKVSFEMENKSVTNAQTEMILGFEAQTVLFRNLVGGVSLDTNQIEIEQIRMANGSIESFSGSRRRSEVFFSFEQTSGGVIEPAILTDGSHLGAALHYVRPDHTGLFNFNMDYRRPNWDFVEGVVNGISRDRVEARRDQRLGKGLSATGSIAGNRYQTREFGAAASSVGFSATLAYQILENPLSVEYGIEAEYRRSVMTRTDPSGVPYHPVPLISREVHFVDVAFARRWSSKCWTEAFAGLSKDRLGGSGPFAGANLKCEPVEGLGGHIWADHRLDTVDTSQAVFRLGGSIFWRF